MKIPANTLFIILALTFLLSCTEHIEKADADCVNFVVLNYSNLDSLRSDPIFLRKAEIKGDCLNLTLQYGGGCKDHLVKLALIQPKCGTPPVPPPTFEIRHDAQGDGCKALIEKEYSFNISGIRQNGKNKIDFIVRCLNASGSSTDSTYTYQY